MQNFLENFNITHDDIFINHDNRRITPDDIFIFSGLDYSQ